MAVVTTAVIGVASAAVAATQSFQAAATAKEASSKADAAAARAMQEAKQKAEKDSFSGLTVPLDAYEAEFENNLAVQQQNVEALQEGDARGLAAGVGRVGAQGTSGAEGTRIKMGEEISDLNMMKAESKEAINQQLIEMDVANAKEQNQRRADADAMRAQSIQSGIGSVGQGLQSAATLAPLYGKSRADKRGSKLASQFGDSKSKGSLTDTQFGANIGAMDLTREQYENLKAGDADNFNKFLFENTDWAQQKKITD
tara:strand:+ start:348 stop:1115 length:768 start_codon:yes stop_codon:yes gene_type:complete